MILILDTPALLSGLFTSIPSGIEVLYVTPQVAGEIREGRPREDLERLLDLGLVVRAPRDLEGARELSRRTGDLSKLSEADISVIALALELKDAEVLTDDFRVQNVLKRAGIKFSPAGELGGRSIGESWAWEKRCRGCGRRFPADKELPDCPVCGSELRMARRLR